MFLINHTACIPLNVLPPIFFKMLSVGNIKQYLDGEMNIRGIIPKAEEKTTRSGEIAQRTEGREKERERKRENVCVWEGKAGTAAAAEAAVHRTPLQRYVRYDRSTCMRRRSVGSRRDAERSKRGEERRKSFFTFFL